MSNAGFLNAGGQSGAAAAYYQYSVSTVLDTLWPVAAAAAVWLILFIILRRQFPRLYSPRSYGGILPARYVSKCL